MTATVRGRTAFKVPRDWELFDRETRLGLPPGPQPSTPDPIRWLVGIDGDPDPSVAHILDPSTLNTDHTHSDGAGVLPTSGSLGQLLV